MSFSSARPKPMMCSTIVGARRFNLRAEGEEAATSVPVVVAALKSSKALPRNALITRKLGTSILPAHT